MRRERGQLAFHIPEARRIIEQKVCGRQASYILHKELGWTIFGPSGMKISVNYITAWPETREEQMNRLYDEEYCHLVGDCSKASREYLMALVTVRGKGREFFQIVSKCCPVTSASRKHRDVCVLQVLLHLRKNIFFLVDNY